MLLVKERRKVGTICGHYIFAITRIQMIVIPNATSRSNMSYSKDENRSFVHSACKCDIYWVLEELRVASRINFVRMYRIGVNFFQTSYSCLGVKFVHYSFVVTIFCYIYFSMSATIWILLLFLSLLCLKSLVPTLYIYPLRHAITSYFLWPH